MLKRKRSSGSSSSRSEDREANGVEPGPGPPLKVLKVRMKREEDEEQEEGECEDDGDDGETGFEREGLLLPENEVEVKIESEEFDDGYDKNFMGDEEDQRWLAQMTEKNREEELYERSLRREKLQTRFDIEKKLRLKARTAIRDNEQDKASLRRGHRERNGTIIRKRAEAMKVFKEIRVKKEKKKTRLRAVDVYSSSSSSSSSSASCCSSDGEEYSRTDDKTPFSSSSDEYEIEKDRKKGKVAKHQRAHLDSEEKSSDHLEEYALSVHELDNIRVSRSMLAGWSHSRFFGETVTGCFVKISIGSRKGIAVYRVAQVMEVAEMGKVYSLKGIETDKGIITDKGLKLKHGREERVFSMEYVSNKEFGLQEFILWRDKLAKDCIELPTKELVERKKSDIYRALNHINTDSDIEAMIREKERFKQTPERLAVKKTQMLVEKEVAKQLGDKVQVEHFNQQIRRLEERADKRDHNRTNGKLAISLLNERNRHRNIIEGEKALREGRAAVFKSNEGGEDPFTRRKCKPTLPHLRRKEVHSLLTQESIALGKNGTPCCPSPRDQENDLYSVHSFELQVNCDVKAENSSILSPYNPSPHHFLGSSPITQSNSILFKATPERRPLSLEDYKKRQSHV